MSYCDDANKDLKYAWLDTEGWHKNIVPDPAANVGTGTSIAVDAFGNPRIAYFDRTDPANVRLKYAEGTFSEDGEGNKIVSWNIVEILTNDGNMGFVLSIALMPSGNPAIAFQVH